MPVCEDLIERLGQTPNITAAREVPLSLHTRFGLGGPAAYYVQASTEAGFAQSLEAARASGLPYVVIGGGTNLIVSDLGFPGIVLRFTASAIQIENTSVRVDAGADLQALVDLTVDRGLKGLETMTGIPGSVGAAVYGNAGAYGHSIMERVASVRFFDGGRVRTFSNAECEFAYRESIFKRHKDWIIFSAELALEPASADELRRVADGILKVRNEKYPPTMKCAGSIFKNLLARDLPAAVLDRVPPQVIREGKVPSAFFLEQAGAKGMRIGDIQVADYHANLIFNAGQGSACDLTELIGVLKDRVHGQFGLMLEEEVQYVGF